MSKTIAIVQSNYIPWKGYFDLINMTDEFVFLDDVQYTRRDWRNRNKIKTPQGLQWLSIPVDVKGKFHQKVCEVQVQEPSWARQHWGIIARAYEKSTFFQRYCKQVEQWYVGAGELQGLSQINYWFVSRICDVLGITTKLSWSNDYETDDERSRRLLSICQQAGATRYLSGPAAKGYLDEELLNAEGIEVEWMDYSDYPSYPQLHGEFEHSVSVLDLIYNVGEDVPRFMKSFVG